MTFRAKPVVKRAHRPAWETQDRRNFYLNLGFGIVVVVGIAMLLIAAGLDYYNNHLASVASVNGQSISKDDLKARVAVDGWRLDEADSRIATALAAGRLSQAAATQQQQTVAQARSQIESISLERLIDARLQAGLAADQAVSVTPEDVDAQFIKDATTPEQRHVSMIEVEPVTEFGAIGPTESQIAAAKAKADAAAADLASGKAWDDVAATVSTDATTAPQGGDLGWIQATDTRLDETFQAALFDAALNTPTDVILGNDGVFRIGRVTEIAPESVDADYQAKIVNDGVSLDDYRTVLTANVIEDKLTAAAAAPFIGSGPQREVSEIYVPQAAPDLGDDAVRTRHILYSPNNDPSNASSLADDDPAWDIAKQEALATWVRLQEHPELFDAIARSESDETQAQGPTGSGGKLPYFDSKSSVDEAFLSAILAPGLTDGQILEPVKSSFGWHVIQIMNHPTDEVHLEALKAQVDGGADFGVLARDNSFGPTAGTGGDLGWVAKGQLASELTDAIFATPTGGMSAVVAVPDDGTYLFKVIDEAVRTPAGRQLDELRSTAFSNWYDPKKADADIVRGDTAPDSTVN